MKGLSLIVAYDKNKLIGIADNKMPWGMSLKGDLKRVKNLTEGNVIVMGRKTFESLGRPLPNRLNVILTNDVNYKVDSKYNNIKVINNKEDVFNLDGKIFIFGGSSIYKMFLDDVSKMYVTEVTGEFEGDVYFPEFDEDEFKVEYESDIIVDKVSGIKYRFIDYVKIK